MLEELLNGIESNNDGVGFTVAVSDKRGNGQLITEHAVGLTEWREYTWQGKDGDVHTGHTRKLDATPMEDLARRFIKLRKRHPEGPAMFHSRLATGGVEDTRGCHPYKVGGDITGTVLAHNGIMFQTPVNDWRSDTRIFAEDILPNQFRKFWKPKVQTEIEREIGGGNKIAIITVNPRFMTRYRGMLSRDPYELFLFNEEAGYWTAEGAWHSNWGYKPSYRSTGMYGTGGGWDLYGDGEWAPSTVIGGSSDDTGNCALCQAVGGVDIYTNYCKFCDSCNDCMMPIAECECYVPGASTAPASVPLAIESGKVDPVDDPDSDLRDLGDGRSPDEQYAECVARWFKEWERDESIVLTWTDYRTVMEARELHGEIINDPEAWLANRAAINRVRVTDRTKWAVDNSGIRCYPDEELVHGHGNLCSCVECVAAAWEWVQDENAKEKARKEAEKQNQPGIITRLAE